MSFKLPFYIPLHPFKGFWDMKYEKEGDIRLAFLILAAFILASVMHMTLTGFVVAGDVTNTVNIFWVAGGVLFIFGLFCISNWCVTTLMQGEGNLKDICMATAYALMPVVIFCIPLIIFSHVITYEEMAFYSFFLQLANVWAAGLLFIGILTVHQYTVTRTIVTLILTAIVMAVIIYIMLLLFSLAQQIHVFFFTIYEELNMRR